MVLGSPTIVIACDTKSAVTPLYFTAEHLLAHIFFFSLIPAKIAGGIPTMNASIPAMIPTTCQNDSICSGDCFEGAAITE
jgi:hypothetical protein